MGSKLKPAPYDCFKNALPDEPMFHLLARDPTAPAVVRHWALWRRAMIGAREKPESDTALVAEAEECAAQMEIWRDANNGRWRTEAGTGGWLPIDTVPDGDDTLIIVRTSSKSVSPGHVMLCRRGMLRDRPGPDHLRIYADYWRPDDTPPLADEPGP